MLMHRDNAGMHGEGIFIGTSGWSYGHWKGPFYPAALPAGGFLPFYAGRFCTVEINSSFYRLPEERTLSRWRDSVPDSFVFAVKGSGFITPRKKPRGPQAATRPPPRAAVCICERGGRHSPEEVTAAFVYVRLHGPAGPYRGLYDAGTLARWAGKFRAWAAQGRRGHCHFCKRQEG